MTRIALRAAIVEPGVRVVVIGAGFIGLEVAATARPGRCRGRRARRGAAPLIRGAGAELGTALAAIHPDNGVDIRTGVAVAGIEDGGVRLGDRTLVAADHVVVGIGVAPTTAWLDGSGLELRDGVVTTPTLSTGVPGVFAAGDLVRWHNPTFDEEMRVEHWTNAAEHGALRGAQPARGGRRRRRWPSTRRRAIRLERSVPAPHPVPRPLDDARWLRPRSPAS